MTTLRPIREPVPSPRTAATHLRDAAYHARLCERSLSRLEEQTTTIASLDVAEQRATVRWVRLHLLAAARLAGVPARGGLDGREPQRRSHR